MEISTMEVGKIETSIRGKELQPGDVFRFAEDSFQDAIQASTFWIRVVSPEKDKDNRAFAVAVDGKTTRVFDTDRLVVRHKAVLHIAPNT